MLPVARVVFPTQLGSSTGGTAVTPGSRRAPLLPPMMVTICSPRPIAAGAEYLFPFCWAEIGPSRHLLQRSIIPALGVRAAMEGGATQRHRPGPILPHGRAADPGPRR
jgi:hypothetical protein